MSNIINLQDLVNNKVDNEETTRWLIKGLIKENSINLVSGDPGSCKSMLTMNMIKALVDGESFLGRETKVVNKILYVSTEMDSYELKERFEKLEIVNLSKIDFMCFGTLNWNMLSSEVDGYDVIVIDVLQQFISDRCDDQNDYRKVYAVFDYIRQSEELRGHTWLTVHHLNRRGLPVGTVAFEGSQDTRITMKMPNGRKSQLRVMEYYGKQIEADEIKLKFEYPKLSLFDDDDDSIEKIQNELSYIVEQVINRGKIEGSATSISSELGLSKYGRNPITLTKYLYRNEEILNENNITIERGKDHAGRSIKLTYKKEDSGDTCDA